MIQLDKKTIGLSLKYNSLASVIVVDAHLTNANKVNCRIIDINGKILRQQTKSLNLGDNQFTISTKGLPTGIFFAEVIASEERKVLKFKK